MIKENKKKILLTLLSLLLLVAWFYWFQYRPAQIKHDCSWIKRHSDAIPARPTMTETELRTKGVIRDCTNVYNDSFSNIDHLLCQDQNNKIIESYKQIKPAEPAKDWWVATSDEEYKFCLRDKGL